MQGDEDTTIIEGNEIDRSSGDKWFESTIKADAGVGEEPFNKDMFPMSWTANNLRDIFGDV